MLLFKIVQIFLLPSVFIFILILTGLLFSKKKTGKILLIVGIALYYLFSITPLTDLILKPLEDQYKKIEKTKINEAKTIVLLLGSGENNVLRSSEVLKIYFENLKVNKDNLKIIISGTNPLNQEDREADGVKEFLINRGVLAEDIILEEDSRNTLESAENIKKIIGEEQFFLVTSAYHMPRSMESFRRVETNPIAAPTDFKVEKGYNLLDFFPDVQNLRNVDLAFHEYFGILWYRLKY